MIIQKKTFGGEGGVGGVGSGGVVREDLKK